MKKKFKILNYNQTDSQGDVFLPGSMKQRKGFTPVTVDFNNGLPISKVESLIETTEGVFANAKLPENAKGLYPAIGFKVVKAHIGDHGARVIDEFNLYEVSLVGQPNADPNIPPID